MRDGDVGPEPGSLSLFSPAPRLWAVVGSWQALGSFVVRYGASNYTARLRQQQTSSDRFGGRRDSS